MLFTVICSLRMTGDVSELFTCVAIHVVMKAFASELRFCIILKSVFI